MKIRDAAAEDAERLLQIYAYYVENTAVSFEYDVPSPEEFRRRIRETLRKYPYLVAEEGGAVLGYCYAGSFHERAAYAHCCELSIYVERNGRRKGCGQKLYEAMEQRLRQLGFRNLYACIAAPIGEDPYLTGDSERFHRHMGFTRVGEFHQCGYKFSRWYNMIWMEKFIGEHPDSPDAAAMR